jgi:hypothetical protein
MMLKSLQRLMPALVLFPLAICQRGSVRKSMRWVVCHPIRRERRKFLGFDLAVLDNSALLVTGLHGGYAARGFKHFASYSRNQLPWYLNPFEFFRLAFATDEVPKPDRNTIAGRRIYYSHIDGDGWRNQTEARYRAERIPAAEVILRDAIRLFPDLPVTVGHNPSQLGFRLVRKPAAFIAHKKSRASFQGSAAHNKPMEVF